MTQPYEKMYLIDEYEYLELKNIRYPPTQRDGGGDSSFGSSAYPSFHDDQGGDPGPCIDDDDAR